MPPIGCSPSYIHTPDHVKCIVLWYLSPMQQFIRSESSNAEGMRSSTWAGCRGINREGNVKSMWEDKQVGQKCVNDKTADFPGGSVRSRISVSCERRPKYSSRRMVMWWEGSIHTTHSEGENGSVTVVGTELLQELSPWHILVLKYLLNMRIDCWGNEKDHIVQYPSPSSEEPTWTSQRWHYSQCHALSEDWWFFKSILLK